MEKEMVSFSSICKEMYNSESSAREYKEYYDEKKDRFKEIMNKLGIDIETFRKTSDNSFELPASRKEEVKRLLNKYTSKAMKAIRKGKFRDVPLAELKSIVDIAEDIINDKFDGKKRTDIQSNLYLKTRVKIDEAINELQKKAMETINKDIEDLRDFFGNGKLSMMLSESDKVALINYYTSLLLNTSIQFKAIVSKVSEIRNAEINQIIFDTPFEEVIFDDENRLEDKLQNIQLVIWEAINEYKSDQIECEVADNSKLEALEIAIEEEIRKEMNKSDTLINQEI